MENITKEKFKEYVYVQKLGICNMLDYNTIKQYATLTKEEHRAIIVNFAQCKEKFND